LRGKVLRLIQDPFNDARSDENDANRSSQFGAAVNRRFKFQKRSQLFIRVHHERLSVVAVCLSNPDRARIEINR